MRGYRTYVASIQKLNERYNVDWKPRPYEHFQWKQCVLCKEEIRDDPYGHSAYPLSNEGVCCSLCNEYVVEARITRIR